jgi:murein L,D-transpeptidase YafK
MLCTLFIDLQKGNNMKLNNIPITTYSDQSNQVTVLLNATFDTVQALDGKTLTIHGDNSQDDVVAVFGGYELVSMTKSGDNVSARFQRVLEADTKAAIEAQAQNVRVLQSAQEDTDAAICELYELIEGSVE